MSAPHMAGVMRLRWGESDCRNLPEESQFAAGRIRSRSAERAGVIVDRHVSVAIGPSSLAGVEHLHDSKSP